MYEKYKTVRHPLINPFSEVLGDDVVEVRVSSHTPLNKAVGFALRKLRDPETRMIVLVGFDDATEVARKCARILQRKVDGLHQRDAHAHKIQQDIWVPKDPMSKLDSLSVKRHLPVAYILLAKGELPEKLRIHSNKAELTRKRTQTADAAKD